MTNASPHRIHSVYQVLISSHFVVLHIGCEYGVDLFMFMEIYDTTFHISQKRDLYTTYISRLENGKTDVQLSTLFRIFERLGRRVCLSIL